MGAKKLDSPDRRFNYVKIEIQSTKPLINDHNELKASTFECVYVLFYTSSKRQWKVYNEGNKASLTCSMYGDRILAKERIGDKILSLKNILSNIFICIGYGLY